VAQGVPARLRLRIFLAFRHYKDGGSSAIRTGRLYPRRNPWYSLSETESTSGHMVLSGEPRKKSPVTPPGIDPGTVRLVAQCLNHYATPGTCMIKWRELIWEVITDFCWSIPLALSPFLHLKEMGALKVNVIRTEGRHIVSCRECVRETKWREYCNFILFFWTEHFHNWRKNRPTKCTN